MKSKFWKNKKVLITGVSGFVGSNAAEYFSDLGAQVTGTISLKTPAEKITKNLGKIIKKINIERIDLLSPLSAQKIVKGQDIILHFAALDGSMKYKKEHTADIFSDNMRMNLNMLEAAGKIENVLFVFMSSAEVYSNTEDRMNEQSRIDMAHIKGDGYKLAKLSSEIATKQFSNQYGFKSLVLRTANLYGPGDEFTNEERMRVIPSLIKKLHEGSSIQLVGTGKEIRSFLYITDFLSIVRQLIEKDASVEIVTVAGSRYVTLPKMVKLISSLIPRDKKSEIQQLEKVKTFSRKFDITLLKSLVGEFEEIPLELGLKKTISFYQKNYL